MNSRYNYVEDSIKFRSYFLNHDSWMSERPGSFRFSILISWFLDDIRLTYSS